MNRTGWLRLMPPTLFAAWVAAFAVPDCMSATKETVFQGRVSDTSDNWLPDVRVALRSLGVVAETDGNGLFELKIPGGQAWEANREGAIEYLELDKEGYQGRSIAITDPSWLESFQEPVLEPNPVGEDNAAFTMRLPSGASIHGLARRIGKAPGEEVTGEDLRVGLERIAERGGANTERASFYAYVPSETERLRAAFLISLHGMGSIDHPVLRRFADENDIALVGVEGPPIQRGCYPVSLLDAPLERLGEMTGHPELVEVPVLTFGHSNGTGFATVYAAERPERLIGWISYHSGHDWQLLLPGVEEAPGLVMHGHLDKWLENGQEQAVLDLRGKRNAPVAMMLEGNVGHGPVDPTATWEFIVEFCLAALRLRLGEDGRLAPVEIEAGWLGGVYDRDIGGQQHLPIAPYAEYDGEIETANWLPDGEFAGIWQLYGRTHPRTGEVVD